jgi:tetratricopeptide (TPR) repeat protein
MIFYRLIVVGLLILMSTFSVYAKGNYKGASKPFDENEFHQALLAEFYNQSNKPKLTLTHYLPIALKSDDPILLKRVTEIATGSAQLKKGLEAAKHWVDLSPKSLEAQQYFTLLLLRDGQLKKSARQLNFIRKIVDKEAEKEGEHLLVSKGLKFIGALLVIESHHDKAYRVFNYYLSQVKTEPLYKDQKQLILASLGMKAKEYSVVVSALDAIEMTGSEYFANAAIMKTKALQKLGRLDEAAELLQKIVNTQKISDSLRLELTRLLVSVGKRTQAEVELEKLVENHPDNNDLLKALIALNVTQKEWVKAKTNNIKLSKSKNYHNEASYFYGEISEGQGDLQSALAFYMKVKKGIFLRKSYSKRVRLVAQIEGIAASQQWLHTKQKKASKSKDKSYWLKLEADLLADTKLSLGRSSRQKNLNSAIKLYDEVIALSPKQINYRYHRGLIFERTNQIVRAESDFNFVIKQGKIKADALNALGYLLVKHTDRLDEAKTHIERAFKLKPNDAVIMDSLGWVYYRTGEVKKAENYLRKAFRRLKTPEVASHLIAVLSETKKYQEARVIFNAMIKKYPNNASLDDVRSDLEHI